MPTMSSFEETVESACKDGTMLGIVVLAAGKHGMYQTFVVSTGRIDISAGSFRYERAFGSLSLKEGETDKPVPMNAVMALASATKILTCVAAMQCVERGLFGLDDDVATILPELTSLDILTGFDDEGRPVLKKRQIPITLRCISPMPPRQSIPNSQQLASHAHSWTGLR